MISTQTNQSVNLTAMEHFIQSSEECSSLATVVKETTDLLYRHLDELDYQEGLQIICSFANQEEIEFSVIPNNGAVTSEHELMLNIPLDLSKVAHPVIKTVLNKVTETKFSIILKDEIKQALLNCLNAINQFEMHPTKDAFDMPTIEFDGILSNKEHLVGSQIDKFLN